MAKFKDESGKYLYLYVQLSRTVKARKGKILKLTGTVLDIQKLADGGQEVLLKIPRSFNIK